MIYYQPVAQPFYLSHNSFQTKKCIQSPNFPWDLASGKKQRYASHAIKIAGFSVIDIFWLIRATLIGDSIRIIFILMIHPFREFFL